MIRPAELSRRLPLGGLVRMRPGVWEALVLPALVLLVLGFALPVGTILSRTFTDHTGGGGAFGNLDWFFGSPTQVRVLLRTFLTAGVVTMGCLLVSYPFAYLLTVVSKRWRVLLLGVVVVSTWQSILVRNYGWRVILRKGGPLNDVLSELGLGRVSLLGTTTGVIIAMTQVLAPFMILPLYAGMQNIDRRLLLAARSLGSGPVTAFARVYLPLSMPAVVAGSVLVGVFALGFYITPALVGSTQNALISQAMQLEIGRTFNWGHVGAQGVVLLVSTLLPLAAASALARRRVKMFGSGTP